MLAIAAGGALGALFRFWLSSGIYKWLGQSFPYGTMVVNVIGSFVMGLLFVALTERWATDTVLRAALLVGLLGAFTTFSTFSIETLNLIEQGALIKATINIAGSVILCLAAVWFGVVLGRSL